MMVAPKALQSIRFILKFPMWQKLIAWIFSCAILIFVFYTSYYQPTIEVQDGLRDNIKQQSRSLRRNIKVARHLPERRKEYDALERELHQALDMLPKKSQIPELLKAVSGAARDSGLDIKLFNPTAEKALELYAEVPVSFEVHGTYEQVMSFLRLVGSLSRIVNVHGMTIRRDKNNAIIVRGQATTYRFIDKKEDTTKKAGKKK